MYVVQDSAHPPKVLPIVQLVRGQVADSGLSLRDFAKARRISYSTLRRYHDKRLAPLRQPPRSETLRELALALDLPLGVVEQTALESLSYRSAPPVQPARPVPVEVVDISHLTPRQRSAVRAMLDAFDEPNLASPSQAEDDAQTADAVKGLAALSDPMSIVDSPP